MVRTQVYFSEEQHRALRQAARREGVSMTALLRRMVERELLGKFKSQDYAKDAVMALADIGRSGRSDISENHDEALAEAFRDEAVR
jgi:Ribbon-helix-helix protein, copG family